MKIGIFGGSFNPVHFEHINMALNVVDHFGLDKLIICPSKLPPHKIGVEIESFEHRFKMLQIAFQGCATVEISDFENNSSGANYTYITIEHFAKVYSDASLFFLLGTDMLLNFPTWKNPERILAKAQLIVTPRDGDNLDIAMNEFENHFNCLPLVSPYVGKNISSTKARAYIQLGVDASNICPVGVLDYIDKQGIYSGDKYYQYVKTVLTPKRLKHTANVIVKAVELAKQIGVDKKKAELSALLHDVAKYLSVDDFKNFKLPNGVPTQVPNAVIHQFLGAFICENILGIDDQDVLNSVRFHTTGRKNMSDLEKVVFLADLIEEDRSFEGVEEIRKRVYQNFDDGFAFATSELLKFLGSDGVYPLTLECANFYNKN